MSSLQIAVCGGGNGAHACAALMTQKGHRVGLFTPVPGEAERIRQNHDANGGLEALIEGREVGGIRLDLISDDPARVIPKASVIFVIVPAFAHKTMFRHIAAHMDPEALVVVLPCRGMMELELERYLPNAKVMAFQTLPWSCRLVEVGRRVDIKGVKNRIQAAARPAGLSPLYDHLLEELLEMQVDRVRSMLTLTLANIGQIFHPGIMYGQFKNDPHRIYQAEECPLFYQGVDAQCASILQALADEVQLITKQLCTLCPAIEPQRVQEPVEWLKSSYGDSIADNSSLQRMLNTNKAYQGIKVTMNEVEGGFQVNFHVRYVTEDVPYSLLVTRELGQMAGASTPMMDEVIAGLGSWIGEDYLGQLEAAKRLAIHSRLPAFYGYESIEELLAKYPIGQVAIT